MTFGIIGGDMRQRRLADGLMELGETAVFGLGEPKESYERAVGSDVLILPLPAVAENNLINMPLCGERLPLEQVMRDSRTDAVILGGKLPPQGKDLAHWYDRTLIDYFEREELQVLNAIPTAEGAVGILMEESGLTLAGSTVLVLGFGRVAKVLAHRLKQMGAHVTVAARKCSDRAWCKAYGYGAIPFEWLEEWAAGADALINTVPAPVVQRSLLVRLRDDCPIIDLASKPGGVDMQAAAELGKRCIWALSLPGKVAPVTGGDDLKETICNILEEREGEPWRR